MKNILYFVIATFIVWVSGCIYEIVKCDKRKEYSAVFSVSTILLTLECGCILILYIVKTVINI